LISVEEFAQMPQDECIDYELVEGELVPMSSGTPRHAIVRDDLISWLKVFLRQHTLGVAFSEVDCRTLPNTVRRPDISFWSADASREIDLDRIPSPRAPDIAIEILSPYERAVDVHRKTAEYLKCGSQEVWLLDVSNQEIYIHAPTSVRVLRAGDLLQSGVLPGFSVPVSELLSPAI
ncbi:MAG: Uma2 family endonuclease, partial [Acidobacteriota bacterium]|nr:Uma2 family endonuclease [Acidobacteriota bacterium]